MMSFELKDGLAAGQRFCESLGIITRGVSLGGVESLIQHPASMSHLRTPPEVKARLGISDGLLRFSVGIEDAPDLQGTIWSAGSRPRPPRAEGRRAPLVNGQEREPRRWRPWPNWPGGWNCRPSAARWN